MDFEQQNKIKGGGPANRPVKQTAKQPFPPPASGRARQNIPANGSTQPPSRQHSAQGQPNPYQQNKRQLPSNAPAAGPDTALPPYAPQQTAPAAQQARRPQPNMPPPSSRQNQPVLLNMPPMDAEMVEKKKGFNAWILVSVLLIVALGVGGFYAYRIITREKGNYKKLEQEQRNAQETLNSKYQAAESERASLEAEVTRLMQQVEELEEQNATPSSLKVGSIDMQVPQDWTLFPGEDKGNYYLYGSKKPGDASQGYISTSTLDLQQNLDLADPELVTQTFDQYAAEMMESGETALHDYYESEVQSFPARIYSGTFVDGEEEVPIKIMLVLESDNLVIISATNGTAQDSQILLDSIVPHTKGDVISLY